MTHSRLYLALRERSLTIRAAAVLFGVGEQHLGNVALGRTYASTEILLGLAKLGINPNEVLPDKALFSDYKPQYAARRNEKE